MASLIATPALNAKVYRHFAAITLAITATVALFADGEARQTIGDDMSERDRRAAFEQASTAKFGQAKLGDRRRRGGGGGAFGREEIVRDQYGAFEGSDPFDGEGPLTLPVEVGGAAEVADLVAASPDELDAMTPAQRAAYSEQLRKKRTPQPTNPATVSREQIGALMAASAARSGSEGID